MNVSTFKDMAGLLQAFTLRDVQMVGVFLHWASQCKFTFPQIMEYITIAPKMDSLAKSGYFNQFVTPEMAKEHRVIEKLLPRDFRRELRHLRLDRNFFGRIGKRGGG